MYKKRLFQTCLNTSRRLFTSFPSNDKNQIRVRMQVNKTGVYGKMLKSDLEYLSSLRIDCEAHFLRMSGIICTIGPASSDVNKLESLMEAGMNIARLNFSHGTHESHSNTVKNIRQAVENYSKKIGTYYPLAIALDTKGPEIRTGVLDDKEVGGSKEVELIQGEKIRLQTDKKYEKVCTKNEVYVDYANITKVVKKGDSVYVDDGFLMLTVTDVSTNYVECVIENGGMLGNQKGVNLPGLDIDLPTLSEKDKDDLRFAIEHDCDMIFASFIRGADQVREIREILGECGKHILIVSKIENHRGVHNSRNIIKESDGVLVARGDLGIEISPEKVFLAQKSILAQCNEAGKPGICATQMLESMTFNPRATRAESSDVVNAIIDGADCVMLSGESAKGKYPVECTRTMDKLCREAESAIWIEKLYANLILNVSPLDIIQRISMVTVTKANELNAAAIIVISSNIRLAQTIAKFRPKNVILAVTNDCRVARQCHLYRGLLPVLYTSTVTGDCDFSNEPKNHSLYYTIDFGMRYGILKSQDIVVMVTGEPKNGYDYISTNSIFSIL